MTLQTLLSNPTVQALGIALLHFVWQGLLLALLLWMFLALAPKGSARLRYAAGCAVLLAMPVMLLVTPVLRERPAIAHSSTAFSSEAFAEPSDIVPFGTTYQTRIECLARL